MPHRFVLPHSRPTVRPMRRPVAVQLFHHGLWERRRNKFFFSFLVFFFFFVSESRSGQRFSFIIGPRRASFRVSRPAFNARLAIPFVPDDNDFPSPSAVSRRSPTSPSLPPTVPFSCPRDITTIDEVSRVRVASPRLP